MNAITIPPARSKPKIFSSQAAGHLLHKPGLIFFGAVFIVAAWSNQTPIVLLMGLFLSLALVAKAWSRLCLFGVTSHRTISECRVFPGEKVKLTLHLANRKPLPLPWVQVEDYIPTALTSQGAGSGAESALVRRSAALLWYRSVRWTYSMVCNKRGYYPFGPIEMTSGDIFGLYSCSLALTTDDCIIVYPKIYPVSRVPIPSIHPMGNSRSERCLFQDPTRAIGVRDYRLGDSLRHIHWKASARAQGLQVKVFEPTTTLKIALFLGVDSFNHEDTFRTEDFELGISAVASISHDVIDHGGPAGLFVNTRLADSGHGVSIPPSGNRAQLAHILEALAKVTPSWSEPFRTFLERERKSLLAGTTLVFVISSPPNDLLPLLLSLKESGYKVLVLFIGEQRKIPIMDGIPWLNVQSPMDLSRT
jgi:uncharacterized protein (DUF58 family)